MSMQLIESLAGHPLVVSVGWMLVHFVWQATLVGVVIALLLGVMRRTSSHLRYVVACAGLGIMTIAPAITLAWLVAGTDAAGLRAKAEALRQTLAISIPGGQSENNVAMIPIEPGQFVLNQEPAGQDSARPTSTDKSNGNAAVPVAGWYRAMESMIGSLNGWMPWCVVFWMAGVVCLAVRLLTGLRRVRIWRREGTAIVEGLLVDAIRRLTVRMNLRQPVLLLESASHRFP